ncbi:hypothetical protein EDEG_02985 [Edhazardia aedis USNM 41457]|uniref:Uncharacterized protein n=1 Tax=Edhazardia aedis (strain USNM 41457) TaxID=1003232 RepID=J9DMR4_EDHAE|nr:hypothetical protein EDEG_02985 [Edhazardia aedis USNM 41457]|eukprot:EJW02627.1 hypothetical protein EDEG_02985 [Edhazardia aedis USNM 41457]
MFLMRNTKKSFIIKIFFQRANFSNLILTLKIGRLYGGELKEITILRVRPFTSTIEPDSSKCSMSLKNNKICCLIYGFDIYLSYIHIFCKDYKFSFSNIYNFLYIIGKNHKK